MKKLNHDITWQEIYQDVRNRTLIEFIATRDEIEFQGVEQQYNNINFDSPFSLDTLSLYSIQQILAFESIGKIAFSSISKIRLLTKLLGGQIWYERIGNGDEWKLTIAF